MTSNETVPESPGPKRWSTDLFLPPYRTGECGDWRISGGGELVHDRGYHSGTCLVDMLPVLSRRVRETGQPERWETWMSLTPLEIESQEAGCRHAFGHTAIMGLGMGWVAVNAALNPEVDRITIVELDPAVIELFTLSGALQSLDAGAQRKICIVEADALDWTPGDDDAVDFLYADIWRDLAEPQTLRQVRRMQRHVRADKVYYWGQEIALHCAVGSDAALTVESLQEATGQVLRLPLLLPDDRDYPQMIRNVIRNRIERGLPVEIDVGDDG